MGNCGNSEVLIDDTDSDYNIGLSCREKKLIREMWYQVNNHKSFRDNGSKFFIMLFTDYPYIRTYFSEFTNISIEDLKLNYALRAHGISVFSSIALYIDCLDDPQLLKTMIYRKTDNHHSRLIQFEDMENLRSCLGKFLNEECKMSRNKEESIAAMDKLMSIHNEFYKLRLQDLIGEKSLTKIHLQKSYY